MTDKPKDEARLCMRPEMAKLIGERYREMFPTDDAPEVSTDEHCIPITGELPSIKPFDLTFGTKLTSMRLDENGDVVLEDVRPHSFFIKNSPSDGWEIGDVSPLEMLRAASQNLPVGMELKLMRDGVLVIYSWGAMQSAIMVTWQELAQAVDNPVAAAKARLITESEEHHRL